MSCRCQQCGEEYRVDVIVSDHIWEKIKPPDKENGAGLLCGSCILIKIEGFGKYGAFTLRGIE